jgi:hypothetical protein
MLLREAHGGEFANFIVKPRNLDIFKVVIECQDYETSMMR